MTLFDAQVAVDPTTNQLVKDGALQVFAEGDVEFKTPLAIQDLNGLAIQNVSTSPTGMAQGFNTVQDHLVVVAKSGPHTITLRSAKGTAQEAAKEATVEAKGFRDEAQAALAQVGPRMVEELTTPGRPAQASITTTIRAEVDGAVTPAVTAKVPEVMAKDATIRQAATQAVADAGDDTFQTYDVKGPGTADDKARFIAAATAVAATGRKTLRVAPGTYAVTGLTPQDISMLYVVGDGVSLPGANVYPFTTQEWVGQSAARTTGTGGRGVVAFEVDDALYEHWSDLFPLTKELGITMGTAWHTENGAKWITEAHRHGWEVIFHMPYDADWTTKTEAEVDAAATAGLAAIEATIGTRENIGFVYPRHLRNATMDRILSKYFTRGRGGAGVHIYPPEGARAWLTSAYALDAQFTGGVVSETLKDTLRTVARTDGRMVMYLHFDATNKATHSAALRELVKFIRDLGIQIQNPAQVWGRQNIAADPYDTRQNRWTPGGAITRSTEQAYHGDHSFKFQGGASWSNGTITSQRLPVASRPGMFSVWRASVRHKTAGTSKSAEQWGIGFLAAPTYRTLPGGEQPTPQVRVGNNYPYGGALALPAAEWERIAQVVYLGPAIIGAAFAVEAVNIAANGVIYLDEIKLELVDYVPAVNLTLTLNGTTNVFTRPGVLNLSRYAVQATPLAPLAGQLTVTTSDTAVTVKSSDAADVGQKVAVTIFPGGSFYDLNLLSTGA